MLYCDIEHRYILEECGCIDRGNATQLKSLDEVRFVASCSAVMDITEPTA